MTMMKTALLIGTLAFVAACGSSKKKEETAATPAPATPAASAPVAETKTEKTKGEKKMTRPTKQAAASTDPNAKEVKCTSGADERLLAIATKDEGCELTYTKAGEAKVIATQIIGDGRCVEVMNNVRKNLEGAQFSCQ